MKNKILLVVSLVFIMGCYSEPLERTQTQNKEISVDFLFEYEGCRVYRFQDGGYNHYFTNCSPGVLNRRVGGKTKHDDGAPTQSAPESNGFPST